MRDKTLTALVILAAILSVGHSTDHMIRGDLQWPLTLKSVPFIVINLTIYSIIAFGLYFYSTNRIGPGFWAIVASAGATFGWLAHFSRFADQPPRYILGAYDSVAGGWLALSCLIALMVVLMVAALYAGYLWTRRLELR